MGFFEWLGDAIKPGPVGHIEVNTKGGDDGRWHPKAKWLVWLLTLLGVGFLGVLIYWIATSADVLNTIIASVVYLVIARFFTPIPDDSNMGWAGGLINNPFRFSDNANRLLAILALLLIPGKIIIYSVQTIINSIRSR